jgi:hypothetical protein
MGERMRSYVYVLLLLVFASSAKAEKTSVQARYSQGKALFAAGKDVEAQELLAAVPVSDEIYGLKSRYILAASFSRQGQFSRAHSYFSQIIGSKVRSLSERYLKDLAILGRARLYYEQNKMREAVLAYRQVGLDSAYAALMLYELSMAYVHYGDSLYAEPLRAQRLYQSGATTLEQLFNLDSKVLQDPRVRLMAVDLLVRLGEHRNAALLYANLVKMLLPMRANLSKFSQRPEELVSILLANQNKSDFVIKNSWVYSHKKVQDALRQLREALEVQDSIKSARVQYNAFLQTFLKNNDATMAVEVSAREQIARLNQLEEQAKNLEQKLRFSFSEIVTKALPLWLEQSNWLLAGADSGLVRSALREQYQYDRQIQMIEMERATKLSQLKKQFEMSHGGAL